MKILLLGKNGQVGWELRRTLAPLADVAAVDYPEINFTDTPALRQLVAGTRPDVVVNAAAYTAVDKAEKETELCRQINAVAPGVLADEAKKLGALMVHYSTDYIFDGTKSSPYAETDTPNPMGAYGRSKLEGDRAVKASGADHLIFRLCWVYGARGQNFMLTMQRLARERETLRVVGDQFGCPTWSRMIAEATALALKQVLAGADRSAFNGEYHLAAGRPHELARICFPHYRVDAGGGTEMPRGGKNRHGGISAAGEASRLFGFRLRQITENFRVAAPGLGGQPATSPGQTMNLLITGGAGFIGSNLIHHVIDRPEVARLVNLDCLTYAGRLENLEKVVGHPKYVFEEVDLRDKAAVFRVVEQHAITHVMHLAAESHVDRSITGPGDFIHTNVVGTFNLLEACRACWLGPKSAVHSPQSEVRFHHVSTDEVFGSLGSKGFFTETTPYAPNSPYSASKASSDFLVRAYHHTYGLPAVITNCSNNYGPFQFPEKLIPVVIQSILARKPVPVYGDGMNVRDWLYVRDHAGALWTVLTRGKTGETYNVGGHNEWANLRIVELICDLIDEFKPELGGHSRKLISFVTDRPGHDRRYAIDAAKIQRELGWTPAHRFEDGIRETVRWYLDNQAWVKAVLKKS